MWFLLSTILAQASSATGTSGTGSVQVPPGIPGAQGETLQSVILNAIQWALGIAGAVAIIYIIVGGFFYITAGGDTEKIEKAKRTIRNAIIGVIFILISVVIVFTLNQFLTQKPQGGTPNTGGGTPSTGGGTSNTGSSASASTPRGGPSTANEEGVCTITSPSKSPDTMNATKSSCDAALANCNQLNQNGCGGTWFKTQGQAPNTGNPGCTIKLPNGTTQNLPTASFDDCSNATAQCTQNLGGISTGQSCTSEWHPPK